MLMKMYGIREKRDKFGITRYCRRNLRCYVDAMALIRSK